jgi:pimeloyl-ACP methyl ester carboxylesterase
MESSASAGRVASAVLDPRRWWVLALLCGAFFMVPPDGVWVVLAEKSTDMADLLVSKQDPDVAVDRHRGDGAGGGDFGHGEGLSQTDKPSGRPAGRQIDCPALLLNATDDDIDIHGGPERVWEPRVAGPSSSAASHSGHHEAEQAPDELTGALRDFLVTPMQPASQP